MEKSCKNCKHWDAYEEGSVYDCALKSMHQCNKTYHSEYTTEWVDGENILRPEYKDNTAFVVDGSGYYAAMYTAGDHYCSMWNESSTVF